MTDREQLARITSPERVDVRFVADLWPIGLMRSRSRPAGMPATVVRPESTAEVQAVVRWAAGRGRRVTALGGGSGVCGAIQDTGTEIVLDLTGLAALEIDDRDLLVRAGAGLNGMVLEKALEGRGLTLGHFPSSLPVATVGGLVATRSSGQQSAYHGNIEDLVLGLRVVLPDGTLVEPRAPARSAVGPALHELFAGSEGALGIIVEAILKVSRVPAAVIGRGVAFPSLEAGLEAMREVMQRDLRPLVMRLYDVEDTAFQGLGAEGCLMVVAVAGEPELVAAQARVLDRVLGAATQLGEEPWRHWLDHRFKLSAERLRQSLEPPGSFVDTIEIAGPWSRLAALHVDVKARLGAEGVALCHFSHPTRQGCCAYFTFAGAASGEEAATEAHGRAWEGAMAACRRHGAGIGHHHGTGLARGPWVAAEMGEWLRVWKAVRGAIDPDGIMNPRAVGGVR